MTKEEKAEKRREYMREYMRERWRDPDKKARILERRRERYKDPEVKARVLECKRERRQDPAVKARMLEYMRNLRRDPAVKARMLESDRRRRQDPAVKARMLEYDRAYGGTNFRRAIKRGNHAERFKRVDIFIRDGYVCAYCGKELDIKTASLDHIIPISKGGAHTPENCTTSCLRCNLSKAAKILPGIMVPTSDN